MANRSKSLFRGPNVKHYALVHRSQRDPLINDPESSDRVLAEVNKGKGRSRKDLESTLGQDSLSGIRVNEGEAALHGIYYDDTDYDYMKHLRIVGETTQDGYELGTLVEAPRKNDLKGKGKEVHTLALRDGEDEKSQQSYREFMEANVAGEEDMGLRPDMDPALREILEALEDEAYVQDDDDDDFFAEGDEEEERAEGATEASAKGGKSDFIDDLIKGKVSDTYRDPAAAEDQLDHADAVYSDQVARFKRPAGADSDEEFEDDEEDDEDRDTIAELMASNARRPARKTGGSVASASAFSMSSSSMFRNEGLRTLDDRFDQMEALYEDSDSDEEEELREYGADEDDVIPKGDRGEQFKEMMDDFLEKYEVLGGKLRPQMEGKTPAGKLEFMRNELAKMQVLDAVKRQEKEASSKKRKGKMDGQEEIWLDDEAEKEAKWDCETILSTYSNLENHPRMIRLQNTLDGGSKRQNAAPKKPINKIVIDPRTGFPVLLDPGNRKARKGKAPSSDEEELMSEDGEYNSDDTMTSTMAKRGVIKRNKTESAEEKRARKAEVKAERAARRTEKRAVKNEFGLERKRQLKSREGKLSRENGDVASGNVRGIEVMRLS